MGGSGLGKNLQKQWHGSGHSLGDQGMPAEIPLFPQRFQNREGHLSVAPACASILPNLG